MGRPAYPVEALKKMGTTHKTKKELAERKNQILKLGTKTFRASENIIGDRVAYKRYKEIIKMYREGDISIATTSIAALLERYVILFSQHAELQRIRKKFMPGRTDLEFMALLEKTKIDSMIHKQSAALLQLEKELGLTLFSKIVPIHSADKKLTPLDKAGFGDL